MKLNSIRTHLTVLLSSFIFQVIFSINPGAVYKISIGYTGNRVISVENSSIDNNAKVFLWTNTNVNSQRWRAIDAGDGRFYFENLYSGKMLQSQGSIQIVQNSYNTSDSFKWRLESVPGKTDMYYIYNNQQAGCLELVNGTDVNNDGSPLRFFTKDVTDNSRQIWKFEEVEDSPNEITPSMRFSMMQSWKNRYFNWLKTSTGFWGEAECLEIILDAYETTGKEEYKQMFEEAYAHFVSGTGGWGAYGNGKNWMWNEFNDDVAWAVLASIRAYLMFGSHPDSGIKYLDIAKTNFDNMYKRALYKVDNLYYVLRWKQGQEGTTSCVNGPSEIAACYLGIATGDDLYFQKAKMLYDSQRLHMYEPSSGRVYDSFDNNWASAYNQGTFLGAALMLYNRYGNEMYKSDAQKIIEYTMKNLCNSEGIITSVDSESGDYVSFKAILLRYVRRYVVDLGKKDAGEWLQKNALKAYNNRNSRGISRVEWKTKTDETDNWNNIGTFAGVAIVMNAPADLNTIVKDAFNTIQAGSFNYISKAIAENSFIGEEMELTNFENEAYLGYNLINNGNYFSNGIILTLFNDSERTIEIRLGSNKGRLLASKVVNSTNNSWKDIQINFDQPISATQNIYFVFKGNKNSLRFKSFRLIKGVTNFSTLSTNDITDDGGVTSAQYQGFGNETVNMLIDNNLNTKFLVKNNKSFWIQYKANYRCVLNSYSIASANDESGRDPQSWTLSGSLDGVTWTKLDSRENQVFDARNCVLNYKLDVKEPYQIFKLDVISNNGADDTQISEWQLIGDKYFDSFTCDFIESGDLFSENVELVELNKLRDNDVETFCSFPIDGLPVVIQYKSSFPIQIQSYSLTSSQMNADFDPASWKLYASKDGLSWIPLDSRVNMQFSSRGLKRVFERSNSTPYNYFKIEILAVNNQSVNELKIAEFELNGYYQSNYDVTSNLNGVITAQWEGNYKPDNNVDERFAKLIDKNKAGKYLASGRKSFWATFQSARPVKLIAYSLTSANDAPNRDPKNWTLYGSDNNINWTVIDKQTNQYFPFRHTTLYFNCKSSKRFKYIKLDVESNYDEKSIQLAEWQLIGEFNDFPDGLIDGSGIITASNDATNDTKIENLIDKNETQRYYLDITSTNFGEGIWFKYEMKNSASITSYALTSSHDNPNNDPSAWKLQGSNNDIDWNDIDIRSENSFDNRGERKVFQLTPTIQYKYIRLYVTDRKSSAIRGFQLAEWELFGTVASSVKQMCNINTKVYPNPFVNSLNIESKNDGIVSVYNSTGSKVYSKSIQFDTTLNIDMNSFSEGVYFIEIISIEGVETQKVIKQ
ncbi:hypothetical protein MASR2M117_08760 [Paludibacter sp.]